MTLTWLLPITLAALPAEPPAERLTLDCRLQTGAVWNTSPGDVSAIRCVGMDGFFVPSPTYRLLRRPEESEVYRLLDQELQLAKSELSERALEAQAANRIAESSRQLADRCWSGWEQSADGLAKGYEALAAGQASLASERAKDSQAPMLWIGVGVLVGAGLVLGSALVLKWTAGAEL